jgi:SAM-dependent methyltransferase
MTFEASKRIGYSIKRELITYRDLLRDERTPASAKWPLGLARIKSTLGKTTKLLWNFEQSYQKSRRAGTKERWKLIQSRIAGDSSLLDVGCSSGAMTGLAAEVGLFAIGLDGNWDAISDAHKQSRPNLGLAYTHFVVTPQSVTALPVCDIVLCLSVYHQWHRDFGHEGAQQILYILGTKARKRLFFEPASKQSRYGPKPPAFVDRDEPSIIDYNHGMLGALFGNENVEFLGGTTASRSEPVRYLFTVQMQHEYPPQCPRDVVDGPSRTP